MDGVNPYNWWAKIWSDVWDTWMPGHGGFDDVNPYNWWAKIWSDVWDTWMPGHGGSVIVKPIFKEKPPLLAKQDLCGVLMPFDRPFEKIFNETLKPSLENVGFTVKKADNIFFREEESTSISTGAYTSSLTPADRFSNPRIISVMERIWLLINQSRLLVADVTGKNANVFYELGIAHTIGKDVIVISQEQKDIPFDIQYMPFIIYGKDKEGQEKLRQDIENVAKEARPKITHPADWWHGLNVKNPWPA
jgi:hypothetical protein